MVDTEELIKKINPKWVKPMGHGITLCFSQENSEKVNNLYKKIIKSGFDSIKEPWDAFWGQRYCSVKDPDGNQIDIYAPLESKKAEGEQDEKSKPGSNIFSHNPGNPCATNGMTHETLHQIVTTGHSKENNYIIFDVRSPESDFIGGNIKGAVNN
eukprot:UN31276